MYTQEVINIGQLPNDGQGDPLRVAFDKINNNFSNLFTTFTNSVTAYTDGPTANQVIFETTASTFAQAQFFIKTINTSTPDSQSIQMFGQLNNDSTDVKYTAFASTFAGDPLSRYDMDVDSGNVRLLSSPIVSDPLVHLVYYQIMSTPPLTVGIPLLIDGVIDATLFTEASANITTEQSV